MLTDEDIDVPRTPTELRGFIEQVRNEVLDDKAERDRGIRKRGPYKRFLDEVVPLSLYSRVEYSDEFRLLPVKGNQPYDAAVFDAFDREIERIEIAVPHDGEWEAKDARLLLERGYGRARVWGPGEDINELRPFVMATAAKKALIGYDDATTLVFVLSVMPFDAAHDHPREATLNSLVADLGRVCFSAGRVRVFIPPNRIRDVPANKPVQSDSKAAADALER